MEHPAMKEHGGVAEQIHSFYGTTQQMLLSYQKFAAFHNHNQYLHLRETRVDEGAGKPLNITGARRTERGPGAPQCCICILYCGS